MPKIKIDIDDRAVRDAFNRLLNTGTNLAPIFKDIGQAMANSTRARWRKEIAPDGTAWKGLSPVTLKRKRGTKILQDLGMRGGMLGSINVQLEGGRAVSVNVVKRYAATHQFGRGQMTTIKGRRNMPAIPARPFLGVSDDDKRKIVDIITDHIRTATI